MVGSILALKQDNLVIIDKCNTCTYWKIQSIIHYFIERQAHIEEDCQTSPRLLEGTANMTQGLYTRFQQTFFNHFLFMTKNQEKVVQHFTSYCPRKALSKK